MRQLILGAALAVLMPIAAQAEGDAAAGEKAFAPCKACHNFEKNGVGPSLKGVVGRKAASAEGYSYSQALKDSGITWDEANLKEWLIGPATNKVKGTKMAYPGLKDDKKVEDVIAYLKSKS